MYKNAEIVNSMSILQGAACVSVFWVSLTSTVLTSDLSKASSGFLRWIAPEHYAVTCKAKRSLLNAHLLCIFLSVEEL